MSSHGREGLVAKRIFLRIVGPEAFLEGGYSLTFRPEAFADGGHHLKYVRMQNADLSNAAVAVQHLGEMPRHTVKNERVNGYCI